MITAVNKEKCIGCRICVEVCPPDVFAMDEEEEKAIIKYPDDCIPSCYKCELNCPTGAIEVSPFRTLLKPGVEKHG